MALFGVGLVLTTTLRALQAIGEQLRAAFESQSDDIQVLLQGQAPKRQLMQQFLREPRSVLVGSQSFWEGIAVGNPLGIPGGGKPLKFRILHVFEFDTAGQITRENVWLDYPAMMQQLS